ncbi:unnamed protein product, partial [Brassica oleracea var. botrytis]
MSGSGRKRVLIRDFKEEDIQHLSGMQINTLGSQITFWR